jgi:outer membrane murein-binding lipoprotein Lpp
MKTKLWAALAHLMLLLVIAIDISWIAFAATFLVPKFQKLAEDGVIDLVDTAQDGMSWMPTLLDWTTEVLPRYTPWLALAALVFLALFESRVKSANKSFIRLSALGVLAVALTVMSALVGASLAIPHLLSGPVTSRMARTFARVSVEELNSSLEKLERLRMKEDWDAMKEPAARAFQALYNLDKARPAVPALWSRQSLSVEELRTHVQDASARMKEVGQAIVDQDSQEMAAALDRLRQSYAPVRAAAEHARD